MSPAGDSVREPEKRQPEVNTEEFGKRPALGKKNNKKIWLPRTENHRKSSKQQWTSALEVICWRGSALRSIWGDCPDMLHTGTFLSAAFPVWELTLIISLPSACQCCLPNPSSFWRLPGEKVWNYLPSRGSSSSRVKNSRTWILELSRSFSQVFLPFFCASTVVWDCSPALQDGSERKSPGWVAKSSQPLLRMRESRVCLPTLTQLSLACLSFTKPSSLSYLGLGYLEMKCHQEHLCPVGVYEPGQSVILSCLSFNLWKH